MKIKLLSLALTSLFFSSCIEIDLQFQHLNAPLNTKEITVAKKHLFHASLMNTETKKGMERNSLELANKDQSPLAKQQKEK